MSMHVYLGIHKDPLSKAEQDRLAMPPPTTSNQMPPPTSNQITSGGTIKQEGKIIIFETLKNNHVVPNVLINLAVALLNRI